MKEQPGTSSNKPLRPGDVLPAIRSAPAARACSPEEKILQGKPPVLGDLSVEETEQLRHVFRSLPYHHYLRTPWWRARRNRALHLAGYRCNRCPARKGLEVHHTSYDRIGFELDTDLEVLCGNCHTGEHFNQTQNGIGLCVRVLSEILAEANLTSMDDIVEEGKVRCARRGIPYPRDVYNAAVARVLPRFPVEPPRRNPELFHTSAPGRPLTHAEACGVLSKFRAAGLIKAMPHVGKISLRRVEHLKAAKILAAGVVEQIRRVEDAERVAEEAERAAMEPQP